MSLSQNTQDSGLRLCSKQQFQVVSKNLTSLYKDSYYKWLDYFGTCSSITIRCIHSAAALVMSIVIYSLLAVFANWGWRGVGVVGWSIVLVMSLGRALEGLTFREVRSVQQCRDAFSKLARVYELA